MRARLFAEENRRWSTIAKAGVGSGVLNTSRQLGGALGIAVLGAIVTTQMTSALESGAVSVRKYRPVKRSDLAEAAA